jgi:hypothetical protein
MKLAAIVLCGVSAFALGGCSDRAKLTNEKAQRAIAQWFTSIGGIPALVTVTGVLEVPQENAANADLIFSNFDKTARGNAIFIHYNDGRWVLNKIVAPDRSFENIGFVAPDVPPIPLSRHLQSLLGLSRTPSQTVKDFMMAVNDAEAAKVAKVVSAEFLSSLQERGLDRMISEQSKVLKADGGIQSIEIEKETITGTTANVVVDAKRGAKPEKDQFMLVTEAGDWKIARMSW